MQNAELLLVQFLPDRHKNIIALDTGTYRHKNKISFDTVFLTDRHKNILALDTGTYRHKNIKHILCLCKQLLCFCLKMEMRQQRVLNWRCCLDKERLLVGSA